MRTASAENDTSTEVFDNMTTTDKSYDVWTSRMREVSSCCHFMFNTDIASV